ncbi:MAG: hypothetical protein CMM47_10520 [Rhodospirillaceae bacterium]|nr:hypothetical protein [Rhodospirillaceae bacterium]|tara:strand:- start:203 stop:700 length:498 start_codon:yes stop_codon:yes gene_type:complete
MIIMVKTLRTLLVSLTIPALLAGLPEPGVAETDDEEVDASTKERQLKEKEQKKRDKKFNDDRLFRFMVGPSVLPVGPFTISLYVRGKLVEGKLRVAIQASDPNAKNVLEDEKWAINGIIYPLAVRMWEDGRPSTEDIINFKADSKKRLKRRFDELIEDVFIESIM